MTKTEEESYQGVCEALTSLGAVHAQLEAETSELEKQSTSWQERFFDADKQRYQASLKCMAAESEAARLLVLIEEAVSTKTDSAVSVYAVRHRRRMADSMQQLGWLEPGAWEKPKDAPPVASAELEALRAWAQAEEAIEGFDCPHFESPCSVCTQEELELISKARALRQVTLGKEGE